MQPREEGETAIPSPVRLDKDYKCLVLLSISLAGRGTSLDILVQSDSIFHSSNRRQLLYIVSVFHSPLSHVII